MGAKAKRKLATRLALFPETLYVTRTDEEDSHYFLASEDVQEIGSDEAKGDIVVYERRYVGRLVVDKQFIPEGN
jgi:hypothetical protein